MGGAAAHARREQRQPGSPQGVLSLRSNERLRHITLAKIWLSLGFGSRQDGGGGGEAAIIVDHAEPRNQGDIGVRHRRAERLRDELAHGLDQSKEAAGGASLADRKLAAAGVMRKRALVG